MTRNYLLSERALRAMAWGPLDQIAREVFDLRQLCAQAYQLLAGLSLDLPDGDVVIPALDNLSAAAQGDPLPHSTILPVDFPAAAEEA